MILCFILFKINFLSRQICETILVKIYIAEKFNKIVRMAGPKKMPISEKFGAEVAEMALDYIKHRQGGVDHRPAKDRPDSVQLFREAAVLMRREGKVHLVI